MGDSSVGGFMTISQMWLDICLPVCVH